MKNLIFVFPLMWCLVQADSSDKQDVKQKTVTTTLNTIPPTPKQELYYQQVMKAYQNQQFVQQQRPQLIQQRAQLIPIQIIAKPYYVHPSQIQHQHQPQPQAMIIIAQPALVPQSLVYGNPTQQLLNYFHSNPQAKYQLLHGGVGSYQQNQPQHLQSVHQQVQPTYVHQIVASPSYGNYIVAPSAHQYHQQPSNYISSPSPQPQISSHHSHPLFSAQGNANSQSQSAQIGQYTQSQQQPAQLSGVAHLAQLAAQQYVSSPMKQSPAIVTGFEHFSPRQQAQIKAQLSTHLGSDFHAISEPSASGDDATSGSGAQYSSKYNAEKATQQEFIPSPQVKDASTTMSSSGTGDILKSQYKG